MPRFSASELFRRSLGLVAKHWSVFVRIQGPFVLLQGAAAASLGLLAMASLGVPLGQPDAEQLLAAQPATALVPWLAVLVVVPIGLGFLGAFVGMGCAAQLLDGRDAGLGGLWRTHRSRLGTFLLTALAATCGPLLLVGVGVGIFALTFPPASGLRLPVLGAFALIGCLGGAVALMLRWSVAQPAVLLGGDGASAGLARSARVTRGSRGRIAVLLFALSILGAVGADVVSALLGATPASPRIAAPRSASFPAFLVASYLHGFGVVEQAATVLAQLVFAPAASTAAVLLYRKLAAPPPSEAPAVPVVPAEASGAGAGPGVPGPP